MSTAFLFTDFCTVILYIHHYKSSLLTRKPWPQKYNLYTAFSMQTLQNSDLKKKNHRVRHGVQEISHLYQCCDIKQHTGCWDNSENNVWLEQMAHVPFSFIISFLFGTWLWYQFIHSSADSWAVAVWMSRCWHGPALTFSLRCATWQPRHWWTCVNYHRRSLP